MQRRSVLPDLRASLATALAGFVHERSADRRLELLRRVTDAYLGDADDHSAAEQDAGLQALLVERADLRPEAMDRLLAMMSRDMAARLRETAVDLDESVVSAHLADWMDDRRSNMAATDRDIEAIRAGRLELDDVVMKLIGANRLLDVATVLSAMFGLDRFMKVQCSANLRSGNASASAMPASAESGTEAEAAP
jgi:hypothetical protein